MNYTFTDQEDDDECGLYNYKARLYDPVLGRFISADSLVPEPGNLQAFNRYSYCVNNPLILVDPSGHILGIDDVLIGMAVGAVIGATIGAGVAAATGGNIGQGALTGAIGGAIFGGAGAIVHGLEAAGSITSITKAGIHAAAGVMSGGINAGITGGDIGTGMLAGGLAAGISAYVGVEYLPDNDAVQVGGRVLLGGAIGGATSAALGGDFRQGAIQGGMSALFGELLNDMMSTRPRPGRYGDQQFHYSDYYLPIEGQTIISRSDIYGQSLHVESSGTFWTRTVSAVWGGTKTTVSANTPNFGAAMTVCWGDQDAGQLSFNLGTRGYRSLINVSKNCIGFGPSVAPIQYTKPLYVIDWSK